MGVNLVNPNTNDKFYFTWIEWHKLLELIEAFGWKPLGTQSPPDTPNWNRGYFSNDGQTVISEDVLALYKSLIDAINHLPVQVSHSTRLVVYRPPLGSERLRQLEERKTAYRNNNNLDLAVISYDEVDEIWRKRLVMFPSTVQVGEYYEIDNYLLTPQELFSGQQWRLIQFASFCKKGSFIIG